MLRWITKKEKYMAESYYWKGKKEIEDERHYVYYLSGNIKYEIHSADRTNGENSGKWVCYYEDDHIVKPTIEFYIGYMAIKNGEIVFCGGNGRFNSIGFPKIALHNSIEEAKQVCEFHNQRINDGYVGRIYTFAENKDDVLNENQSSKN